MCYYALKIYWCNITLHVMSRMQVQHWTVACLLVVKYDDISGSICVFLCSLADWAGQGGGSIGCRPWFVTNQILKCCYTCYKGEHGERIVLMAVTGEGQCRWSSVVGTFCDQSNWMHVVTSNECHSFPRYRWQGTGGGGALSVTASTIFLM